MPLPVQRRRSVRSLGAEIGISTTETARLSPMGFKESLRRSSSSTATAKPAPATRGRNGEALTVRPVWRTFDPVHQGHIRLARTCLHDAGLTGSCHPGAVAAAQERQPEAPFTHRGGNDHAALADRPDTSGRVSPVRASRSTWQPRHTPSTRCRHCKGRRPRPLCADHRCRDSPLDLPHWHQIDELLSLVESDRGQAG